MRIESAYLCECGEVGDCSRQCVKCGNPHGLLNLATVLNRKSLSPEARAVLGYIPSWKGKVA